MIMIWVCQDIRRERTSSEIRSMWESAFELTCRPLKISSPSRFCIFSLASDSLNVPPARAESSSSFWTMLASLLEFAPGAFLLGGFFKAGLLEGPLDTDLDVGCRWIQFRTYFGSYCLLRTLIESFVCISIGKGSNQQNFSIQDSLENFKIFDLVNMVKSCFAVSEH